MSFVQSQKALLCV